MQRGLVVAVLALLGGCLSVDYTVCGDNYCAQGQLCSPAGDQCVFPEQIDTCSGAQEGAFCSYTGVSVGACTSGVCVSQTTGTLASPETLSATDGSSPDVIELGWTAVSGASGYRVWRDSVAIADVTDASYIDSAATTGGVPAAPANLSAGQGTNLAGIDLAWTASLVSAGPPHTYFVTALAGTLQSSPSPSDTGFRGAYAVTGYQLSVDGGTTYADIGPLTQYTDVSAPVGSWTATVAASDGTAGKVALAVTGIAEAPVTRMYLLRAVSAAGTSSSTITTGFRDVGNPSSYQWQWSDTVGGTYTNLVGATATSFDDTTGPVITQRYYRVLLGGANSATATLGPDAGWRGLTAPTTLAASDGTAATKVSLTWTGVYGATGYRIYRGGTAIADVATTTYDDTLATSGGVPTSPPGLTASAGTDLLNVNLSWSASTSSVGATETYYVTALASGAEGPQSTSDTGNRAAYPVTGYQVSVDGGVNYIDVASTAYADSTAPAGTWTASVSASDGQTGKIGLMLSNVQESFVSRSYKVRAVNGAGASTPSTTSGYRDVGNPTGFQWQWSDTANGTFTNLAGATTTPFDDTTSPVITPRWYRCVLTGANGATGTIGPDSGYRALSAPTNVAASDGTSLSLVSVTWDAVYGATGYRVFRDGAMLADVTTTSYDDSTAPGGSAPGFPSGLQATGGTFTDKVHLTWNASNVSPGSSSNYAVVAIAGTTFGPISAANTGYRGAYPVTYEIKIGAGSFTNVGNVTSYDDTAAPAGSVTISAQTVSDGKSGVISLAITAGGNIGALTSYQIRAVNAAGTTNGGNADGWRGYGPLGYQWQRSAGTTNDTFSDVVGATTATYDDTSNIPLFEPRWYRCVITSAGTPGAASSAAPGWRGVATTLANIYTAGGRGASGVRTTAVGNGMLYIGGDFTYVGPRTGTFSKLSTGGVADVSRPVFSGTPQAALSDGAGGFYLSGSGLSLGGVALGGVVRVTAAGTIDSTFVAPAISGVVTTLALGAGRLYIGGSLTNVGGVARANLAALDATTGALDTAWDPSPSSAVTALAVIGTKLYVGGQFTQLGGFVRNRLGAVDLTTGAVDTFNPNLNGAITTLGVIGTTLYAHGSFTTSGVTNTRKNLASYDTTMNTLTSWNPAANDNVFVMAISGNTVFVYGTFSQIGGQFRGSFSAVDATTGLATSFNTGGSIQPNYNISVMTAIGNTLYIGGGFNAVGGSPRMHLAAIDLTTNTVNSWDPGANTWVQQVLTTDGTSIFVGGQGVVSVGGVTRNYAAAISLTTGQVTSWNPDVGPWGFGSGAGTVEAMVLSADSSTVYLGGQFTTVGGLTRNRLARVSATTGAPTAWAPSADQPVHALALSGTTLYAGGDFGTIGGASRQMLAALDTSTGAATSFVADADASVRALIVSGSTLYAGGDFISINTTQRNRLAAIDATTGAATSWNPGANGSVRAFAIANGALYAGGGFSTLGGTAANHIGAFDLSTGTRTPWSPTSTLSDVGGIAISGNAVYYCGQGGAVAKDLVAPQAASDWSVNYGGGPTCTLALTGSRLYLGTSGSNIVDGLFGFDP